jgi:hypothetical protein
MGKTNRTTKAAQTPKSRERLKVERNLRRLTRIAKATTPQLAAAIHEVIEYLPTYADLADAHTIAEERAVSLRRTPGANPIDLFRAEKAEDRAEDKWLGAIRRLEALARGVLKVPVNSMSEALIKQEAFKIGREDRLMGPHALIEDVQAALEAANADLRRVSAHGPMLSSQRAA